MLTNAGVQLVLAALTAQVDAAAADLVDARNSLRALQQELSERPLPGLDRDMIYLIDLSNLG